MSTQYTTDSPATPKSRGPRNNNNRHHRKDTQAPLLTTPPSSPPKYASTAAYGHSKKNRSSSNRKPRDIPNDNDVTPMKNSPHYAGPTFHASPAPSALPIPSLFSKSLPDSRPSVLEMDNSGTMERELDDGTPSKSKFRPPTSDAPTPVDFLFKAAIEARNNRKQPGGEDQSPTELRSPPIQQRTMMDRSGGGIFELDMDSPQSTTATSMNTTTSSSGSRNDLNEKEEENRRAKTAALKDLLLHPRPQKPPALAPDKSAPPYFNATPARVTAPEKQRQSQTPTNDTKRMEDDLRRILKIGRGSRGVQQFG